MSETFTNPYEDNQGGVAVEEQGDSVDTQADLEREQALLEFKENREKAFSHALVFDADIRTLEAEVMAFQDGMDKDPEKKKRYEEQVHFLDRQREKQQAVAMYERKLWGASPEEHVEGKGKLLEDIALIKDPVDVLALFDRWGALPGANTVDRPVINRDAVASFLSKIQERSDVPDLETRAQKLFPNKRLREKVLQFVKKDPELEAKITEPEVPYRNSAHEVWSGDDLDEEEVVIPNFEAPHLDVAPEVWTGEDEETPLPPGEDAEEETHVQTREETQVIEQDPPQLNAEVADAEKEIQDLRGRERTLTEAQSVIDSPMFKYAPFLMRFTEKGRENLAKVKSAGFTLDTKGASPETLEMARALKLKSIRERLAQLTGGDRAFAHNLSSREKSVKKATEIDYRNTNEVRKERALDTANLESGDTRRGNVRRIKDSLYLSADIPEGGVKKKIFYEKDDGLTLSTDHSMKENGFSAPVARRARNAKKQEVNSTQAESQQEKVTREALAVFNRKKAEKQALAEKVAEVTGKTDLSKKEVRAEAMKMRRRKKAEGKTNN